MPQIAADSRSFPDFANWILNGKKESEEAGSGCGETARTVLDGWQEMRVLCSSEGTEAHVSDTNWVPEETSGCCWRFDCSPRSLWDKQAVQHVVMKWGLFFCLKRKRKQEKDAMISHPLWPFKLENSEHKSWNGCVSVQVQLFNFFSCGKQVVAVVLQAWQNSLIPARQKLWRSKVVQHMERENCS